MRGISCGGCCATTPSSGCLVSLSLPLRPFGPFPGPLAIRRRPALPPDASVPSLRRAATLALRHPWLTHKDLPKTALTRDRATSIDVPVRDFPLRVFKAGEHLAKQGDLTDVIYLIRCGKVQLSFAVQGSDTPHILDELGAGSYVGEWSVLNEGKVDADALDAIRLARPDGSRVDMGDWDVWPADVVAKWNVEAIVMKRQQMIWILEHDSEAKVEVKRQGSDLAQKLNTRIREALAQQKQNGSGTGAGARGGASPAGSPAGRDVKQVTESERMAMAEALMEG